MAGKHPWHNPGKWFVNPAYWEKEALEERAGMPAEIRFIDSTISEGDDSVGHTLNWNTRVEMVRRLDAIGVGAITLCSHATFAEEIDLMKACRRMGIKTPLVAKGPGVSPPLSGKWRDIINHHIDIGADLISPIFKWGFEETSTDFSGELTKSAVVDAIGESVTYMKAQGAKVVPWTVDSMRTSVETSCLFFKAMADAGADGVYVVDSRGNSTPLASRIYIRRVKAAVGTCPIYVQHHNDLGVATANAMASVEAGATWIDATILGVGDRGGCVALEEAASLFEMYGIRTNIKLAELYEFGRFAQEAYGVTFPNWKPILGRNWNKEEGLGHMDAGGPPEETIGIAPEVVGRAFEGVIGAKLLFGRERSSAWTDDPRFLRNLLKHWGLSADETQFQTILHRARGAVATAYDRRYITIDEFRSICDGVLKS
jgi:isopropylmalate/homocitrate/citramalate synthase